MPSETARFSIVDVLMIGLSVNFCTALMMSPIPMLACPAFGLGIPHILYTTAFKASIIGRKAKKWTLFLKYIALFFHLFLNCTLLIM